MLYSNPARPPLVQLEGVRLRFPQCEVFADLSADIGPGVTLVRGGESRGKTSLLRIIAGELVPDQGSVRINGKAWPDKRGSLPFTVFWVNPRTEAFNAVSPVEYFNRLQAVYPALKAARVLELAEVLGLAPHLEKPLYMLSTGSRRKVFLVAAFSAGATVTLLDEPFAALDGPSMANVRGLLREAASPPQQIWVLADYEPPPGVALTSIVDLGD